MKGKLTIGLLLLSMCASAQWTGYTRIANKYRYLALAADSTFHVPSGTTPGLQGGANYRGALFYKTGDSSLYAYTGSQWLKVAGSSSLTAGEGLTESPAGTFKLGGTISGSDTTLFSVTGSGTSVRFKGNNGLGQKFIIDSIRNFYVRGQATQTQISLVNNAVTLQSYVGSSYSNALFNGGFLTFSGTDSIAYQSNSGVYRFDNLSTTDTTSGKPAVFTSDGKLKKLADWGNVTKNIYNSDDTLTGDRQINGNGKNLTITGTFSTSIQAEDGQTSGNLYVEGANAEIAGSRQSGLVYSEIKVRSDSIRILPSFGVINIDSIASGSTYDSLLTWNESTGRVGKRKPADLGLGTVTSIATGTGLSGGTITGTGTISADTTVLSTRAWRQKGIDSIQVNVNLKVNISDTATMLNNYVRSVYRKTGTDSVFMIKGAGTTFAFKDSAGGSVSAASGSGISLVNSSSAIKRLKAGSGITVTDNTDSVTIDINQPVDYTLLAYQAMGSTIKAQPVGVSSILPMTLSSNLADGRCYFISVYLPKTQTITGVKWYQGVQGNYTADNYNGVAIYSYSGGTLTLVDSSVNDGNIWKGTANTFQSKDFSSPRTLSAGLYYVACLYNSSAQTTAPALGYFTLSGNAAEISMDFTNSAKLYGAISSQTIIPNPTTAASSITTTAAIQHYFALY